MLLLPDSGFKPQLYATYSAASCMQKTKVLCVCVGWRVGGWSGACVCVCVREERRTERGKERQTDRCAGLLLGDVSTQPQPTCRSQKITAVCVWVHACMLCVWVFMCTCVCMLACVRACMCVRKRKSVCHT